MHRSVAGYWFAGNTTGAYTPYIVADNLTPDDRIRTMRAVKSNNTGPERRLRAMLAGLGIRGWRVNYAEVTGKPDIAFPEQKVAVFVDGCFWHQCPECKRPLPQSNRDYWEKKIQRNVQRDRRYDDDLKAQGWKVVRVWGHEVQRSQDLQPVAKKISAELAG